MTKAATAPGFYVTRIRNQWQVWQVFLSTVISELGQICFQGLPSMTESLVPPSVLIKIFIGFSLGFSLLVLKNFLFRTRGLLLFILFTVFIPSWPVILSISRDDLWNRFEPLIWDMLWSFYHVALLSSSSTCSRNIIAIINLNLTEFILQTINSVNTFYSVSTFWQKFRKKPFRKLYGTNRLIMTSISIAIVVYSFLFYDDYWTSFLYYMYQKRWMVFTQEEH